MIIAAAGHNEIVELGVIIGVAVGAQLLAHRLRIPSILLLIIGGFIIGPLTGWIDPDTLFGDLLLPLVSIAVAIILFEGGLTLDLRELSDGVTGAVSRLLTVGLLVTWALGALFAYVLFDLSAQLAILLGAVLVVSGPTVVLPILRNIRLRGRVESVLRWEGIAIDPIGVLLAVLVFEAVVAGQRPTLGEAVLTFATMVGVGALVGVLAAVLLAILIRRGGFDDNLRVTATLGMVVLAFVVADALARESGLLSTVLMGMILANSRSTDVRHIQEFKESIGLFLIGLLFVVLTARVPQEDVTDLGLAGLGYLALLVFLVRPLAVWLSTVGSPLNWKERVLVAAMAPRGIVAAATASIFAVALSEREDLPGSSELVPIAFLVIIGTVVLSGFSAGPLARALGLVASGAPQIMIVGAQSWARRIASELHRHNIPVRVWATDEANAVSASSEGIDVRTDDLLSEERRLDPALGEAETVLILTDNDEFNGLVAERLREQIEPHHIFQIATERESRLVANQAFGPSATHRRISQWVDEGARVVSHEIAGGEEYAPGARDVPLLVVSPGRGVDVITDRSVVSAEAGEVIITLSGARRVSGEPEVAAGPDRVPGAAGRSGLRRLRQRIAQSRPNGTSRR